MGATEISVKAVALTAISANLNVFSFSFMQTFLFEKCYQVDLRVLKMATNQSAIRSQMQAYYNVSETLQLRQGAFNSRDLGTMPNTSLNKQHGRVSIN